MLQTKQTIKNSSWNGTQDSKPGRLYFKTPQRKASRGGTTNIFAQKDFSVIHRKDGDSQLVARVCWNWTEGQHETYPTDPAQEPTS